LFKKNKRCRPKKKVGAGRRGFEGVRKKKEPGLGGGGGGDYHVTRGKTRKKKRRGIQENQKPRHLTLDRHPNTRGVTGREEGWGKKLAKGQSLEDASPLGRAPAKKKPH